MQDVVIVGAGLAGHRAASALCKAGFAGTVTVVGDEPHRPYDRPPLSKQLLNGTMAPSDTLYPCDDLDVRWLLGQQATALDLNRQVVHVGTRTDAVEVGYDGLILATGRGARTWPEPLKLNGVHTLRNVDDSLALRDAAMSSTRVVIIGAGFIGCEVAATLKHTGVEHVSVVDVAEYPMPALGPEVGRLLTEVHSDHGVDLRLGTSVASFDSEHGTVTGVLLDDGSAIEAEVVLLALGSAPSTAWLAGSGLQLQHGNVVCDSYLFAAGTTNVVVAGDVAMFPHHETGEHTRVEHWSHAREMGELAARNLITAPNDRQRFAAVPTFWSDQYNMKIKSAGFVATADSFTVVEEDRERPALVVEAHRNRKLIGAVTINKNKKIIEYTRNLASATSC